MSKSNDSFGKTVGVVLGLCLVCSLVVSGTAVALKPQQLQNKLQDKQKYILEAAGIEVEGGDIATTYNKYIEPRLVNFGSGDYVDGVDPVLYDQRKAARAPETSTKPANDIASISRRANDGVLYLVKGENGDVETVILPIHGYGLWSTMYGFLALESDLNTIQALVYYEQGETPGLGAEVENPKWKAKWPEKVAFDKAGNVAIKVVKGGAKVGDIHGVDGLAGATLTSNGVTNSLVFWLGAEGYGNFIAKARNGGLNNG
ncbi:Na(+)-translocating NADH-quinone reductase subunit C [Ferrimonas lipolytica]|uniref:Na(+)-translocating NADH-quinone reductase subunit C n=1 Tax=Ferrimonas lipolytica TaxID=2724191 RepID=A0A6H1UB67_9GAMM|nr:Na(+)-translocating NADH-quinone reductase subunit C [Ferrimonas lipolytica]QIZ75603.1 Na(+)-translocating NADH-quinone reductase subunit C [Ferrimonas lipolytica]